MQTLPRHLLLVAVMLTVCCAQQQGGTPADLSRLAGQLAGEMAAERLAELRQPARLASRVPARRHETRPAAAQRAVSAGAPLAAHHDLLRPAPRHARPVVHVPFPPSLFRLPPPVC